METAARLGDFKALGQLLQERLQSEQVLTVPFQVQCAIQRGTLLILTQHTAPPESDPERIFSLLEQTIQTLQPEFTKQVRLFLRLAGEQQPYAIRNFTVEEILPPMTESTSALDNTLAFDESDDIAPSEDILSEEMASEEMLSEEMEVAPDFIDESIPVETYEDEDVAPEVEPALEPQPRQRGFRRWMLLLAGGVGLVGVLSLGGIYALTRPCVMDSCSMLQTGKQVNQTVIKTLQQAKSGQDLIVAQKQLADTSQELSIVPFWSPHYGSAQSLLQGLSTQSQLVNQVLSAFSKATIAAQKSQNPPHPVQQWQEIQTLWTEAIAELKQVPPNSPLYSLAQSKLADYQLNLATISQRLKIEQQSEQTIAEAKQTAQVAETKQQKAKSLENWQQVYNSWQTASNALAAIPKTARVYPEAQQLLQSYSSKLAVARDRTTREKISVNNYNQAVSLAATAKRLEQQNQWSQAAATWRQALNYIEQVPKDTFYYNQSKPLIEAYKNALKQSETHLRSSLLLEKTRNDLNRTCSGLPRICDYIISNSGIKVYLTPSYVNRVSRTAATANFRGDYNTMTNLQDHLKTLQSALEAISQNAGLSIELYNHRREIIGRYQPQ